MKKPHLTRKHAIIAGIIVLLIVAYGVLLPYPIHHAAQKRCVVWLECRYCFALTASGCDTLYFNGINADTSFTRVSSNRQDVELKTCGNGFWYSPTFLIHHCRGRILTTTGIAMPDTSLNTVRKLLRPLLQKEGLLFKKQNKQMAENDKQLAYYMNTHDVTDEGYNQVALYQNKFKQKMVQFGKAYNTLNALAKSPHVTAEYLPLFSYRLTTRTHTLSAAARPCRLDTAYLQRGIAVLRTNNRKIPLKCISLSKHLFNLMSFTSDDNPKNVYLLAYNVTPAKRPEAGIVPDKIPGRAWKTKNSTVYHTSLPVLEAGQGAPVVDRQGVLIGIAGPDGIIPIQ